MSLFLNMVFILQLALSSQGPVTPRGTRSKDCLTCKAPVGHGAPVGQGVPVGLGVSVGHGVPVGLGVPVGHGVPVGLEAPRPQRPRAPGGGPGALARGEACGVYTLGSCTRGLRCLPMGGETMPLQALLEGRGVCSENNPTTRIHSADLAPNTAPETTPCHKLLLTVMRGLEGQLFQSLYDLYIPNCDKRGFFKKKQCRSSKGVGQRGSCWCVDENGASITSSSGPDGSLVSLEA